MSRESANGHKEPILVSACLLGLATRYDGKTKRSKAVMEYLQGENLLPIPICPEQLAGMPTPREKTFFKSGNGLDVLAGEGHVVSESGESMNDIFCRGASMVLQIGHLSNCRRALLKERSPSCGVHLIYRGEARVPGTGVTTALLIEEGFEVVSEEDL
ncbi:MAG: DUF523 domain-containing protein [Deltaproteobacteria bacterium]|jgi:uncharacterized protein YbbK (DUF523 family)|nr:DUF523 domain-containing protein [Deltaproteobacteria bacterium]MBW2510874.1 DUF523 domain-containing protein [Deltaproteobacteria bacterium]